MPYYQYDYDTKARFASYWHQINEILKLDYSYTLEIGIGNRFVSKYLKQAGAPVITLDICRNLKPDCVGSVTDMPFADNEFDTCLCCEVLEHLPFDFLQYSLREIHRVTKNGAIISLPDASWYLGLSFKTPIQIQPYMVSLPKFFHRQHIFNGQHYWEIGKSNFALNKIIRIMNGCGFKIKKTYRVFENPYHRFFYYKNYDE